MSNLRIRSHISYLPKHQTGAALLLFILVLVLSASTLLISKLNKASAQYYRDDVTMASLMRAKEALIGYAVSYPDVINPVFGPGHMPCPDRNNDGDITGAAGEINCSIGGGTFIGRIPWEYMGIEEIRDSVGERLWYAISDNYNFPPGNINSETPGQLTLDSDGNGIGDDEDVIAVIIAPGASFNGQNRPSNNLIDYLDGNNNNGDANFITNAVAGNFNDQVIGITRRELMEVVEKRVLGDVSNALNNYRNEIENLTPLILNDGRFPWLSPFQDPLTENTIFVQSVAAAPFPPFFIQAGNQVSQGQLALQLPNQWFPTTFTVGWNVAGTAPVPGLIGDVTADILNGIGIGTLIVDTPISPPFGVSQTNSSECRWLARDQVNCRGSSIIDPARTYDFDIVFDTGTVTLNAPTGVSVRTRDVVNPSPFGATTAINIRITDNISFDVGTNTINPGNTGTFIVSGITYHLGVGLNQELPQWFTPNNWHHLIYVAESNEASPAGVNGGCIPLNLDCLSVNSSLPGNNADVIVISAGRALAGQNRALGTMATYFEDQNQSAGDDIFKRNTYPPDPGYIAVFNDQVRVVAP